MMSIYFYHSALRGGLGPAGGVFPPALLANRHRYWLVARTQIRSPSASQSARVPMDNLGLESSAMKRIHILSAVVLALAQPCWALDIVPYQAEGFAAARAAGKVTALQFHSGWCPVCVMQERGLRALQQDKALDQVIVFQVDFFKEEALRRQYNVNSFATLVVFRGEAERARTTADSRPEQLRQLFAKAL
jgi:thioredoxin 1